MKKNKIAIVLVALLGSISFWLIINNQSKSTIKEELRDFAVADTGSITKIFIADKSNKNVTLEKVKPGEWKVNGKYIARKDAINTLLYTMKSLEVLSPVGKNAQENAIKNLASAAVKVEIYQRGELSKVYYVGGETQDQMGTYMLLSDPKTGVNSSVPFILFIPGFNGYLTSRYFIREDHWRERAVFVYNPSDIRSVKVEVLDSPEQSFEVFNYGNNSFEVKGVDKALSGWDTLAIKQYLSYYQNIQYESLENGMDKMKKDSILLSKPYGMITVTDSKGNSNKIVMHLKPSAPDRLDAQGKPVKYDVDRLYASINDGKDWVLIQYFVFGKLMPEISYFQRKPKV